MYFIRRNIWHTEEDQYDEHSSNAIETEIQCGSLYSDWDAAAANDILLETHLPLNAQVS